MSYVTEVLRSVDWVDGGGAILYHVLHTHYGKKHRMNVDTGRNENGEIVLIVDDAEAFEKACAEWEANNTVIPFDPSDVDENAFSDILLGGE